MNIKNSTNYTGAQYQNTDNVNASALKHYNSVRRSNYRYPTDSYSGNNDSNLKNNRNSQKNRIEDDYQIKSHKNLSSVEINPANKAIDAMEDPGRGNIYAKHKDTDSNEVFRFIYNPNRQFSFAKQKMLLPIFEYKKHFLYLMKTKRIVIVTGVTGSGKSTQLPQYLFENGYCSHQWKICCSLPRKISAITIAQRVAQEMGSELGGMVGYHVPLDRKGDDQTRIWYMTDDIIIREMMNDPLLCKYSVIIIDEAHERTLTTDLLLGLICKILKKRNDLQLVICSATLDVEAMRSFFELSANKKQVGFNRNFSLNLTNRGSMEEGSGKLEKFTHANDITGVLSIQKGLHHNQIEIYYANEPVENYVIASLKLFLEIHIKTPLKESVLIFLATPSDIDLFIEFAERENVNQSMWLLPLYASLPFQQQRAIFENPPEGKRKVIISTSIAETALTIPSIIYVIDSGFTMQQYYDPIEDRQCITTDVVSKSSAIQRAGRAGRDRKHNPTMLAENFRSTFETVGKCFRLYTEKAYENLPDVPVPEIHRSDLTKFVLQLKALGVDNIVQFNLLASPPSKLLMRALEKLYALGVIDDYAKLVVPLGYQLVEFPVDPRLSKIIIQGGQMGCTKEMLTVAAILTSPSMFVNIRTSHDRFVKVREKYTVAEGDIIAQLNICNHFIRQTNQMKWCHDNFLNLKVMNQIQAIRNDLEGVVRMLGIPIRSSDDLSTIQRCIVSGLFENAAQRLDDGKTYVPIHQLKSNMEGLLIHPQSFIFKFPPPYVIYFESIQTQDQRYMRNVMRVEPEWLEEMAPHYYQFRDSTKYRALVGKGKFELENSGTIL